MLGWATQAADYAAVWAEENTRESVFDAMQRRETYATTGPRMVVRLFGGWEFEARDAMSRSPAIIDYSKGVPMDGDLKRMYDVAVAGGRRIGADGRCKVPVGSTADVENATWTNAIGAPELIAVWKDPEVDAKRFGVKMPKEVPMTTTERAYTSPIWYTP